MKSLKQTRGLLSFGIFLSFLTIGVACGISGGPSLIQPDGAQRIVAQPAVVPCDPAGAPFGGGDGLSANTALAICTIAQLEQIGVYGSAYFILASDIDLSSSGYTPQSFSGFLDGNRHVISNLSLSGVGQQAFFISIPAGSEVKNLGFTGVNITSVIGASNDGGATLAWQNLGTISGCFAKGLIFGTGGTNHLGGLATDNEGVIQDSYAIMTFTDQTGNAVMGGLSAVQNSGTTTDSYSVPTFILASSTVVGGITASGSGNSNSSFWDTTISATSFTSGSGTAVGKTTAEMQTSSTFISSAWSSTVWYLMDGSYPKFIWEP